MQSIFEQAQSVVRPPRKKKVVKKREIGLKGKGK